VAAVWRRCRSQVQITLDFTWKAKIFFGAPRQQMPGCRRQPPMVSLGRRRQPGPCRCHFSKVLRHVSHDFSHAETPQPAASHTWKLPGPVPTNPDSQNKLELRYYVQAVECRPAGYDVWRPCDGDACSCPVLQRRRAAPRHAARILHAGQVSGGHDVEGTASATARDWGHPGSTER
jgi:hypothetical protein